MDQVVTKPSAEEVVDWMRSEAQVMIDEVELAEDDPGVVMPRRAAELIEDLVQIVRPRCVDGARVVAAAARPSLPAAG